MKHIDAEQRARDAAKAVAEEATRVSDMAARTARLRALRLAQSPLAADAVAPKSKLVAVAARRSRQKG